MIGRLASFELTLSEELRAFGRYLVRLPQFVRENSARRGAGPHPRVAWAPALAICGLV